MIVIILAEPHYAAFYELLGIRMRYAYTCARTSVRVFARGHTRAICVYTHIYLIILDSYKSNLNSPFCRSRQKFKFEFKCIVHMHLYVN
jgi:hypothetical protein